MYFVGAVQLCIHYILHVYMYPHTYAYIHVYICIHVSCMHIILNMLSYTCICIIDVVYEQVNGICHHRLSRHSFMYKLPHLTSQSPYASSESAQPRWSSVPTERSEQYHPPPPSPTPSPCELPAWDEGRSSPLRPSFRRQTSASLQTLAKLHDATSAAFQPFLPRQTP